MQIRAENLAFRASQDARIVEQLPYYTKLIPRAVSLAVKSHIQCSKVPQSSFSKKITMSDVVIRLRSERMKQMLTKPLETYHPDPSSCQIELSDYESCFLKKLGPDIRAYEINRVTGLHEESLVPEYIEIYAKYMKQEFGMSKGQALQVGRDFASLLENYEKTLAVESLSNDKRSPQMKDIFAPAVKSSKRK